MMQPQHDLAMPMVHMCAAQQPGQLTRQLAPPGASPLSALRASLTQGSRGWALSRSDLSMLGTKGARAGRACEASADRRAEGRTLVRFCVGCSGESGAASGETGEKMSMSAAAVSAGRASKLSDWGDSDQGDWRTGSELRWL